MANLFTVTIPDSPTALLAMYGAGAVIRVQSCPTEAGIYGDVTTLDIVEGQSAYAVYDENGSPSDFYRIRYEDADGTPAGDYSSPFQPMPLEGIYTSLSQFKTYVRSSDNDTTDDARLLLALDAAARAIDHATGRSFTVASGTATARVFTASHLSPYGYVVDIDDVADPTDLAVSFDPTGVGDYSDVVTDFRTAPYSASSRGLPWTRLILGSGVYPPSYHGAVEVTAKWGWTTIPNAVQNANLLQAARFLKRRDAVFGIAGSPEMGNEMRLLAKVDPDVEVMLAPYRKWWGAV